ncbi:MAG: hypothetical protein IKB96_00830, partial [Prevotella sp.]|nr:hypothetical protein [Prevotella sp.]
TQRPPLEVIGFDCCLMATVDTAAAIKGYARYMVDGHKARDRQGKEIHERAS